MEDLAADSRETCCFTLWSWSPNADPKSIANSGPESIIMSIEVNIKFTPELTGGTFLDVGTLATAEFNVNLVVFQPVQSP